MKGLSSDWRDTSSPVWRDCEGGTFFFPRWRDCEKGTFFPPVEELRGRDLFFPRWRDCEGGTLCRGPQGATWSRPAIPEHSDMVPTRNPVTQRYGPDRQSHSRTAGTEANRSEARRINAPVDVNPPADINVPCRAYRRKGYPFEVPFSDGWFNGKATPGLSAHRISLA